MAAISIGILETKIFNRPPSAVPIVFSDLTLVYNDFVNLIDEVNLSGFGTGTVTSVSVVSANGVSGVVATATTTPAITLTLGNITPTSIVATGSIKSETSFILRESGGGADTITLQAPAIAASYTLTLPTTDGSPSEFLQTDGAGNLTWAVASPTPAAMTRVDDTNVTLTLGGSPATSLLAATSLTLGWTGQLASTRGGTGVNNAGTITNASNTTITGGGTLVLGGFTLTVPATGTTALGTGTANRFAYWSGTNTVAAAAAITATNIIFADASGLPTGTTNFQYIQASSIINHMSLSTNYFYTIKNAVSAHGMTAIVTTDTIGIHFMANATQGGYYIAGYCNNDNTNALGFVGTSGTSGAITNFSPFNIRGQKKNGVTAQSLAATDRFIEFSSVVGGATSVFRILGDGSTGIGGDTNPTAWVHIYGAPTTTKAVQVWTSGTFLSTQLNGAWEYNGTAINFTNSGTQRQEVVLTQQTRVSAQFDKTTDTTLANVTGLTATLVAGKIYKFEAVLFVDASLVGGSKYAIAGTATATNIVYEIILLDNGTSANTITSRQTALAGSAGQAGTTAGYCLIRGLITVNAAGTLTVQFAQNASNGTSSILVGSNFKTEQIS